MEPLWSFIVGIRGFICQGTGRLWSWGLERIGLMSHFYAVGWSKSS